MKFKAVAGKLIIRGPNGDGHAEVVDSVPTELLGGGQAPNRFPVGTKVIVVLNGRVHPLVNSGFDCLSVCREDDVMAIVEDERKEVLSK